MVSSDGSNKFSREVKTGIELQSEGSEGEIGREAINKTVEVISSVSIEAKTNKTEGTAAIRSSHLSRAGSSNQSWTILSKRPGISVNNELSAGEVTLGREPGIVDVVNFALVSVAMVELRAVVSAELEAGFGQDDVAGVEGNDQVLSLTTSSEGSGNDVAGTLDVG